jgi:hypothetical protein
LSGSANCRAVGKRPATIRALPSSSPP